MKLKQYFLVIALMQSAGALGCWWFCGGPDAVMGDDPKKLVFIPTHRLSVVTQSMAVQPDNSELKRFLRELVVSVIVQTVEQAHKASAENEAVVCNLDSCGAFFGHALAKFSVLHGDVTPETSTESSTDHGPLDMCNLSDLPTPEDTQEIRTGTPSTIHSVASEVYGAKSALWEAL